MRESSDITFHDDLGAAGPVVAVVFWAEWARKCREVKEFTEAATAQLGSDIFLGMNTDRNPITTHAFDIHRVPTVAIVTESGVLWRNEGRLDLEAFLHAWTTLHAGVQ